MLLATLLTVLGQHSGDKIQPSLGLDQPHYSRVTEGGAKNFGPPIVLESLGVNKYALKDRQK